MDIILSQGSFIEEEEEGGSEHTSEHTRTTRGGRRQCQQSLDPYKLPLRPPPNTNTTEYDVSELSLRGWGGGGVMV